jgi:hypothetical protein
MKIVSTSIIIATRCKKILSGMYIYVALSLSNGVYFKTNLFKAIIIQNESSVKQKRRLMKFNFGIIKGHHSHGWSAYISGANTGNHFNHEIDLFVRLNIKVEIQLYAANKIRLYNTTDTIQRISAHLLVVGFGE